MDGTTATPLQNLWNQYHEGPKTTGLVIPSTNHQPTEVGPALANRPTPYINGSCYFRAQEREFFSRTSSFFRIQIDIDLPCNPQAAGGPYAPPRFIILPNEPSLQQPPPSSSTSQSISTSLPSRRRSSLKTVSINRLPLATGLMSGQRMRQYRKRGNSLQYPYPPPELRHRSLPGVTIDGDTQQRSPSHSDSRQKSTREPGRKGSRVLK